VTAGPTRLELLLVDDDPVIRKSYGNQLRAEGWNITIAADGYEALQAGEEREFDVVLLDLRMPFRNGAEVLRAMRARPRFAQTVVFLLAQPGDADLVDRAMREGADGVFEKARVSPRDIVYEIQGFFNAGGRQARSGGQVAAPPATPPAPANVSPAVEDVAKRFRKTQVGRASDDDVRATRASSYVKDPEAAARAVALRVTQRQLDERDRGPPLSTRNGPGLVDEDHIEQLPPLRESGMTPMPESLASYAPPQPPQRVPTIVAPVAPQAPQGPGYTVVLNRLMGESGKLAAALGLPTDYVCPVCRQQLALKLWTDPQEEAAVRGHFFCPRCTS
jgi:CheY-like chemotaxis protein